MKFESGRTDQYLYFKAVDETDLKTPETGLTGFTVYRSRNGGSATAFTTPTVSEISAANMPGIYALLLDEDMTITTGSLTEDMVIHITKTGMAPVSIKFQLFREPALGPLLTAQGATSNSVTYPSGGITADDQKLGVGILIEEATGAPTAIGQMRSVISSTNSTDVVGLDRVFDVTPSGTVKFRELAGSLGSTTDEIATSVWAATTRTLSDFSTALAASVWSVLEASVSTTSSIGLRLKNAIGGITGTGTNTILGYFQSLMRKDVTVASDIGGTYDDATDSLEAIKDGPLANLDATVSSRSSAAALTSTDGKIDLIKAKTDNLPSDPADASVVAGLIAGVEAKIDTIDDFLDTEITTLLQADRTYVKGVAVAAFMFPMHDTNGNLAPGKTVTVKIGKDGGAFNTVAGAVVENPSVNGFYHVPLSTGEMTADDVGFLAEATGCRPTVLKFRTQS